MTKKPLPKIGRRTRVIDAQKMVRQVKQDAETGLPLVHLAGTPSLDATAWAQSQQSELLQALAEYGVLLFRDFPIANGADFQAFAAAAVGSLFGEYGDLPKERANIYHSTPYPEDRMILFHQESSHLDRFPTKQMFFCVQPSEVGGATPIADGIKVAGLLGSELVETFRKRKLRYIRNFLPGLDVSWQDFFKTQDRDVVAQRCEQAGMGYRWLEKDGLTIYNEAVAIIDHPVHGKPVFFNQIQLHHPLCLEDSVREAMTDLYGMSGFPRNVTFGDGESIDADLIKQIGEAYEAAAIRFAWRKGDVLMLDNLRFAHARDPFEGARKILVAMADLQTPEAVKQAAEARLQTLNT